MPWWLADRGQTLDRESVRVRLPSSLTRRLGNAMRASQKSKRKKAKANRTLAYVSSTLSMATHNLVNMVAITAVSGAVLLDPSGCQAFLRLAAFAYEAVWNFLKRSICGKSSTRVACAAPRRARSGSSSAGSTTTSWAKCEAQEGQEHPMIRLRPSLRADNPHGHRCLQAGPDGRACADLARGRRPDRGWARVWQERPGPRHQRQPRRQFHAG